MRPATSHGSRHVLITRLALALALLAVGLAGPAAPPARAETLVVTKTNNAGDGSLRQAILDADLGDTITFDPSLSGGTIALLSPLSLTKDVTIDGSALAEPITLSGRGLVRVLEVPSGVTVNLSGLVIARGAADDHDDGVDSEDDNGGGIYNLGTLTITDCTLSDSGAERLGGAIYSTGVLTVTNSTFEANVAEAGGGILALDGALAVVKSTFAGNSGRYAGGGIGALTAALAVTNCTFAGNVVAVGGGGIYSEVGPVTLANATFAGNTVTSPDYGGAAVAYGGVLTYTNTIMTDCYGGDCCFFDADSEAFGARNLVDDGSCSPQDMIGDPMLGPLADHGGPTLTMALLPGSPALNAGDAATCAATDQRGVARPQGDGCDIGAYEQELPVATTGAASDITLTGAVLNGTVNARQGVAEVRFEYGLDAGYGLTVTVPSIITGTVDTAVSAVLTDLTPATTYHYRLVADGEVGRSYGAEATFATLPPAGGDLYLPAVRR